MRQLIWSAISTSVYFFELYKKLNDMRMLEWCYKDLICKGIDEEGLKKYFLIMCCSNITVDELISIKSVL